MLAHRTMDDEDPDRVLAYIHPADPLCVQRVLHAPTEGGNGRSPWMWLRLPNGDLMLGVFPQGDTYLECEADAQYLYDDPPNVGER